MMEKRATAIDAINRSGKGKPAVPSQYWLNDQVWLEATNLKIRHLKTKLNPKQYGPFKIIKEISPVAYQLKIPVAWGIHDVFHASLLNPYHKTAAHGPNFSWPPPDLIEGEEEYQVEWIIAHRHFGRSKMLQYLIKWEGYPDSDNTWEPAQQVHAPELICKYHQAVPLTAIKMTSSKQSKSCISPPRSLLAPSSATSLQLPLVVSRGSPTSSTQTNHCAASSSFTRTPCSPFNMAMNISTSARSSVALTITLKDSECPTTPSMRQMSPTLAHPPPFSLPSRLHRSLPKLPPPSSLLTKRIPKPSWMSRRGSLPVSISLRVSEARRERYETRASENWRLGSSMSTSKGRSPERLQTASGKP
jgi:hypothetical protein